MEMCDPAKESLSGQPLPRLSTRRSEGAPCPPPPGALCPPFPAPSQSGLLEGKAPIPLCLSSLTLALQPPHARLRATPNAPVPLPGMERRKGHPRGSGTGFSRRRGATLSSGRGLNPSFPREGKQVSPKKKKKNQPMESLWGAGGVSREDAEGDTGCSWAAGGTRRQCSAGMG